MARIHAIIRELNDDSTFGPEPSEPVTRSELAEALAEALEAILEVLD